MRPFSAFFLLLISLFLFAILIDARRSPAGDYWKSMMNNEPMPEAITDLLHPDDDHMTSESGETESSMVSNHYIRNFDVKPNVILYHNDADSKRLKTSASADDVVKLKPVVSDSDNS